MSGAMEGFLTGFLDTTADNIIKRKDEARTYFEAQMELARTRGLENRLKSQEAMKAGVTSARQLMQMGAPEELVMAIANQNPDDIPVFAKQVAELQMEGAETDEQFFRDLIQVSGEFAPGDMDVVGLFQKIYEPLRNNIKSNPEEYKNDKRGTLWATMMGYNAKERALDKLEDTEVIDGLSAADLLAYGQSGLNKPLGEGTVTLNNRLMGDTVRAERAARSSEDDISIPETKSIIDTFDEAVKSAEVVLKSNPDKNIREGIPDEARRIAARKVADMYAENIDKVMQIPEIAQWLQETEPTPEAGGAMIGEPVGRTLPGGETFIRDLGDGTSEWRAPDGTVKRFRNTSTDRYK